MIITGAEGVETKVKALANGADDYVVKPFHKDELIARMQAVIRRSRGFAHSVIRIGELTLDLDAKRVQIGSTPVHLTGREYQLVELLALRRGKTLTKDVFLTSLYGGQDEPEPKIIDVFICKVRKKLAMAGAGKSLIETVWGGGYLMRDPAVAFPEAA
jgi:two-component system cell cycle response regulator CtrA